MSKRRWLPTLLILAVAVGLAWWGSRLEDRQSAQVAAFVTKLVDPGQPLPADLPAACAPRLDEVRQAVAASGPPPVDVRTGDHSPFGDATATHSALIGRPPKLGLRLTCVDDRVTVIGYWEP